MLVGLVVVSLLGMVGAVVSYRADVDEARRQVKKRVTPQCRGWCPTTSRRPWWTWRDDVQATRAMLAP
jgi:hypothetical protein